MLEHHRTTLCCFLVFWFLCLACESVSAAGNQHRVKGNVQSTQRTRTEPTAEGTDSGVEYVDNGPLWALYDFLIKNNLQKLCQLLRKANLESVLVEMGTWTIFAPTDGSFAFLPGGTLEELEKNSDLMRDFLLHHFISGDLATDQILDEMIVDSIQGAPLRFNIYGPPDAFTVSGAEILQPDLQFELGRIHIIDRPLYPFSNFDLMGYLQQNHNEMYKLVLTSGLSDFLAGGTFTIFAPDDKAFNYLSLDFKDALATNESLAQGVVLAHVLPASMFVRGLVNGMQMNSVGNTDLLFTQRRGLTFVNGVPVLMPDVPVTNGVVHAINRVILPEGISADCQCKPLDLGRKDQRQQPAPGSPYEPSRIIPTERPNLPSPVATSRPAGSPPFSGRPVQPQIPFRPPSSSTTVQRPPFQQTPQRPPAQAQRPGQTAQTTAQGVRPVNTITSWQGQRTTDNRITTGQRQVIPGSLRPIQSQTTTTAQEQFQTVTSAPNVAGRKRPFSPNRIPTTRPTDLPRTQRPWNPAGDTILIDLNENFDEPPTDEPQTININNQPRRPVSVPSVRPPSTQRTRQPTQVITSRRPGQQINQPEIPVSPSIDDNNLEVEVGEENVDPTDSSRPGVPGISVQQRQSAINRIPGQTQTGQGRIPVQPVTRPGQGQVQPVQRPGYSQVQPVQRPGYSQVQTGQRTGYSQVQTGQRPGFNPAQPGQRPGYSQVQPSIRPGYSPVQPGQRPGYNQVQPGQSPEQTRVQNPQRPNLPTQPTQQPGFQPAERPRQQVPGTSSRDSPTRENAPSSRPIIGQPNQRPAPQNSITTLRPIQPRPVTSIPSAPGRTQFPTTRTTSIFPTRRPGQQDHSTKGQTFNPQRHNTQRRPPGNPPAPVPPRVANIPTRRPINDPNRRPFEPNAQSPSCRRRGERVTSITQSLPLCDSDNANFEPCQRLDEPYNPNDSRPPCDTLTNPNDCRPQGAPFDQNDLRPECLEVDLIDCRMPNEPTVAGDRRPFCTGVISNPISPQIFGSPQQQRPNERTTTLSPQPESFDPITTRPFDTNRRSNCRQPSERILPGDRRPLCRTGNTQQTTQQPRPTPGPVSPTQPGRSTIDSGCRQFNERPTIGDQRPLCNLPHSGSSQRRQPTGSPPRSPSQTIQQRPVSSVREQIRPTQPSEVPNTISPHEIGDQDINSEAITTRRPNVPSPPRSVQTPIPRRPGQQNIPTSPARQPPALRPQPGRIPTSPQDIPGGNEVGFPSGQGTQTTTKPPIRFLTEPNGNQSPRRPPAGAVTPILGTSTPGVSDGPRTLYQIVEDPALLIQGRPVKLTKIFQLFQKAGLDYILTDPGPYTVFLPSDDAFLRLPKGVVDQLESDVNLLQQVLLFHVTTAEILPGQQDESYFVPSFQGTPILVTMLKGGRMILISGAKAVAVTKASNGIFYVVNQLIYPLPQDDIVSALSSRPDLNTVSTFIQQSGLNEMLTGDQPYTLFAPTDIAFGHLSESALQELMQNTTALRELLLGHIIPGAHYGREFLAGVVFPNIRGGNLRLNTVSYGYQVNNVNIKTPEIVTGRGVIHVIEEVLLTPEDAILVDRITNTLDGSVVPGSLADKLISPEGAAAPNQGSSQPSSNGWRSQSYAVSYGHTTTRTTNTITGTGVQVPRSPYPQQLGPQLVRHTTTFMVPGGQISQIQNPQTPSHNSVGTNGASLPSGNQPPAQRRTQRPGSSVQLPGNRNAAPTSSHLNGHSRSQNTVPTSNNQNVATDNHSPISPAQYSGVAQLASDFGLTRFAALIANSGLSEKVQDGGTYTVFAPTDEALNSLPPDVQQALDADPNQLRTLLQYHILPQKLSSKSVGNDQTASTLLEGKKLRFNLYNNGQLFTALGVPVEQPSDDSSAVRLIPVSQVLQPPTGNLLKVVESSPMLTEFAKAIKGAHLNWMLSGESGVTLFAPSDAAFQELTEEQRQFAINDRRAFSDLLKSHVVRGTLYSTGLQDGEVKTTENRKNINFHFNEVGLDVNSIPVIQADIPATNGVLYIIDGFL